MVECTLCNLDRLRKSRVYYEDETILIVDNIKKYEFDERIMGIIKKHENPPNPADKEHLIRRMTKEGNLLFGVKKFGYQDGMRTFPDHYHIHIVHPLENKRPKTMVKTVREL